MYVVSGPYGACRFHEISFGTAYVEKALPCSCFYLYFAVFMTSWIFCTQGLLMNDTVGSKNICVSETFLIIAIGEPYMMIDISLWMGTFISRRLTQKLWNIHLPPACSCNGAVFHFSSLKKLQSLKQHPHKIIHCETSQSSADEHSRKLKFLQMYSRLSGCLVVRDIHFTLRVTVLRENWASSTALHISVFNSLDNELAARHKYYLNTLPSSKSFLFVLSQDFGDFITSNNS